MLNSYLSLSVDTVGIALLRVDSGPEEGGLPAVNIILGLTGQVQSLDKQLCNGHGYFIDFNGSKQHRSQGNNNLVINLLMQEFHKNLRPNFL